MTSFFKSSILTYMAIVSFSALANPVEVSTGLTPALLYSPAGDPAKLYQKVTVIRVGYGLNFNTAVAHFVPAPNLLMAPTFNVGASVQFIGDLALGMRVALLTANPRGCYTGTVTGLFAFANSNKRPAMNHKEVAEVAWETPGVSSNYSPIADLAQLGSPEANVLCPGRL
jgi:hypothetical protein